MDAPTLYAISDLHIAYPANRKILESIRPTHEGDWLIVAGDVAEQFADVAAALELLAGRFAKVIWAPGNHELWTPREDTVQLRGEARYQGLVEACRELGVATPEDEFPVWTGVDGPVAVAPLFLLYDYSWRLPGQHSKAESLERAYEVGVVCTDELMLHHDPYPSREAWCEARVVQTEKRLTELDAGLRTVLVTHWPLLREPTRIMTYPEFAQWCGTDRTADWHVRFRAEVAVYGHLHIPRTTWHDGVRFEEVSVGYPREWRRRNTPPGTLRRVLG